ncbi:MAG: hypothetical protein ACI4D4_11165 [Lachnospira sp.]
MKRRLSIFASAFLTVIIFLTGMISPVNTFASDNNTFKFSEIDLIIDVPKELISFTRSTTNNNSYLDKLGVEDATVLTSSMMANNIYLEAVPEDVAYEIAVFGKKASDSLSNFNEINDEELDNLFKEYVSSQESIDNNNIEETLESSQIKEINGIKYFVTDIKSVSNNVTVYVRKYYTVIRGYIYTYAVQSKSNVVNSDMDNMITSIIQSAQYKEVKKSIFENFVVSEIVSNIITIGVPIIILILLLVIISNVGKRGRKKLADEEAELREKYKKEHERGQTP